MKLIAGLGNPGRRFKGTRHNVGFMVIDKFSAFLGVKLKELKHFSLFGKSNAFDEKIILAKPLTFMNLSGEAIASFARYYKLSPRDILIVYDDVYLELGRIRLRECGGSGGHKGVDSAIKYLGTSDFPRMRIGIKGNGEVGNLTDYVLGKFTEKERAIIDKVIARAAEGIEVLLKSDLKKAMNLCNR